MVGRERKITTIVITCVMCMSALTLVASDDAEAASNDIWVAGTSSQSISVTLNPIDPFGDKAFVSKTVGYKWKIGTSVTSARTNPWATATYAQYSKDANNFYIQDQSMVYFSGLSASTTYYITVKYFLLATTVWFPPDLPPAPENWGDSSEWGHATYSVPLEATTDDPPQDPPPGGGGGGSSSGCPYIAPWGIDGYTIDNNILPQSENFDRKSLDVEDNYILNQPLTTKDGLLSIKVMEFENERSTFDSFALKAIDRPANTDLATSPDGEISAYPVGSLESPFSAINKSNEDLSQFISEMDGNTYNGTRGDWAIIEFDQFEDYDSLNLILRTNTPRYFGKIIQPIIPTDEWWLEPYVGPGPDDDWWLKLSLNIQVLDTNGSWIDVATIIPRMRGYSVNYVDMKDHLPDVNGDFKVNITWTENHGLDFVVIYSGPEIPVHLIDCPLVNATNQFGDNITQYLLRKDGLSVDLWPGDEIILGFQPAPEEQDEFVREYMVIAKGHYVALRNIGVYQNVECSFSLNGGGTLTEVDAIILKKIANSCVYEIIYSTQLKVGEMSTSNISLNYHPDDEFILVYDVKNRTTETSLECILSSHRGETTISIHDDNWELVIPLNEKLSAVTGIWTHEYSKETNVMQNVPISFNVDYWHDSYSFFNLVGIEWNFGDNTGSSEEQPTHSYLEHGRYIVTANITFEHESNTFYRIEFMPITVLPTEPSPTYREVDIALSIAGRKDNAIEIRIYKDGTFVQSTDILRTAGQPNTATIKLDRYYDCVYDIELVYDAIHKGANPIWLTFTSGGNTVAFFAEFNTKDGFHQAITVPASYLDDMAVISANIAS